MPERLGKTLKSNVLPDMLSDLEGKAQEVIEKLQADLATIRTGRATSDLVEDIKVEAYDSVSTLKELAAISIPEPRQILISPWDKSVVEDIERALRANDLNPAVDGDSIRIMLPALTGEVRDRLMKEVGERAEESKVSLRMVRRGAVENIERAKESKEISKDDEFTQRKKIDELVEELNKKIDQVSQDKKEQMEI